MNTLRSLSFGTVSLLAGSAALAQNGNMMGGSWGDGWMGGYGGWWMPILVIAVVVGVVVMVVRRKRTDGLTRQAPLGSRSGVQAFGGRRELRVGRGDHTTGR